MLDTDRVQVLRHLAPPVLTAYLDTNPATRRNQGDPPGYLAWLKTSARDLEASVAAGERAEFRERVRWLQRYLQSHPPGTRGVVAFVGRKTLEILPLQVKVEDELHWGPPVLKQLLWLLDEYRPAGVVVVSETGARLFRVWLGEIAEDEREALAVEPSVWRRRQLVEPARAGVARRRGVDRDRFERRLEAQQERFAAELARRVQRWGERHGLRPVLLVGPSAMLDGVFEALPEAFRPRVARQRENLAHLAPAALRARLKAVLTRWERENEVRRVQAILEAAGSPRVAAGLDETLARLQEGRVRELVIARGLDGRVRRCERCGQVDRSADPQCPLCGGPRRPTSVRVVVPELVQRHRVVVDVVAGEAASRLRAAGGVAAWLDTEGRSARGRTA